MSEPGVSSDAIRRKQRSRRTLARRAELRSNLKALVIAAAMVAALVIAFENAGRVFGISASALQSSVAGGKGSCRTVADGRWVCTSRYPSLESGYTTQVYAVEETSRGCWVARYSGRHPARSFDKFETKGPVDTGCLDVVDYFSGDDTRLRPGFGPAD